MALLGETIDDRFELREAAAAGGMGRVYKAWDRREGKLVAVKVLEAPSAVAAERFAREAEVIAGLGHPDIVGYVAHGMTAGGDHYLAMDWVDGETLTELAARRGLSADESVKIALRIASALAELHRRGLVHRDVKPDNLLFRDGDLEQIKVIDFGLARTIGAGTVTRTGYAVGTLGYMAPEQARGQRVLDARVDVFALGCVLFECLTGSPLFDGESILIVQARILFEDPPPLRDLCAEAPPALEALLLRMLAKDPNERPRDAAAVAEELAALGPIAGPYAPSDPRGRRGRRAGAPAAAAPTQPLVTAELGALLGASEGRLVSFVLAALVESTFVPGARTMSFEDLDDREQALRAAVQPFGAKLEVLADGSVVATLSSGDEAGDHAVRAARCALAIRALIPGTPVVLVTGRTAHSVGHSDSISAIIHRGARAAAVAAVISKHGARRHAGGAVLLDTLTAQLLDARFIVATEKGSAQLHGERPADDCGPRPT
jgi:eukaryotic-like serine/threonine-protein kinase